MKILILLFCSVLLFAFNTHLQASEAGLKVLKVQTIEPVKHNKETTIQIEVGIARDSVNSVMEIHFDGTLTPPDRRNPESLVATSENGSVVGFNIRLGVDIYNVYLMAIQDDVLIVLPSLRKLVGRQIQSIDAGLNDRSFIVTDLNRDLLKFMYVGKERSHNYFEFYGVLKNGEVAIDTVNLKKTLEELKPQ